MSIINNKRQKAHDMKMFKLRNSPSMERFVVELFVSNIYTINTCVEFDTFLGRSFFFKGEVNS